MPRILIMAGGTGGHVFPALSIASELQARGAHVEWLGTRLGIEARVIPANGIPLHFIDISGLRGKGLLKKLLAPWQILVAVVQALRKIRSIDPACVLGMGGFVTGPGGVAARLLGRPLLIHEQNAVAGLSNALLFPLATTVMEAFAGSFARKQADASALLRRCIDPARTTVVGNPVRETVLTLAAPANRFAGRQGKLRLLVVGGSLGAAAINQVLPQALRQLAPDERPLLWHQCGEKHYAAACAAYQAAGFDVGPELQLSPFIEDMASAYAWADLVLCRAGASTVSELAAIGLPAILVPYPHAVDDHQSANAQVLVNVGAAEVIQQRDFSAERLVALLRSDWGSRSVLLQRALAGSGVGVRDAGGRAALLCLEACHG